MVPNETEDRIVRERNALAETLERSDDWDETCHEAALRYANALFASGLERDAVVRQLDGFTLDAEHAGVIAHEAQTGARLPYSLEDDDEDEQGSKRAIRWLALVPLLVGLAFVSLVAYGVYLYAIDQKPLRFTGVLRGAFMLAVGIVAIRWGIRSIRTPHRL